MKDRYLTVTALTKYMKRKIDTDPHLNDVWLKGEISNFNHHSRGHMYLTIKDEQTRVPAVMFAGSNQRLKFIPENGMKVLIKGHISIFEPFGQYQLYIQQMEPDGLGSLYLAYEQLKEKLTKQGYFSLDHKKQIPQYPKHIGVVTSPTGAAVRDIITTIKRRYPIVKITVIPAIVQGREAGKSITKAIQQADDSDLFDVLIVGRGGGSIEDLWGFNEEIVADTIYHASTPIISAVGHETDQTISDLVADVRAATPTGAAEIAVPSQEELKVSIAVTRRRLTRGISRQINEEKQRIKRLKQSYAFRYPENLIRQKEQELDTHTQRLERNLHLLLQQKKDQFTYLHKGLIKQHPERQWKEALEDLIKSDRQLHQVMQQQLEQKAEQLTTLMAKLSLLNPLEIMKRGFALPYDARNNVIHSTKQVQEKDRIQIHIADGQLDCEVIQVKENKNGRS